MERRVKRRPHSNQRIPWTCCATPVSLLPTTECREDSSESRLQCAESPGQSLECRPKQKNDGSILKNDATILQFPATILQRERRILRRSDCNLFGATAATNSSAYRRSCRPSIIASMHPCTCTPVQCLHVSSISSEKNGVFQQVHCPYISKCHSHSSKLSKAS
jgi:hypothetical protein